MKYYTEQKNAPRPVAEERKGQHWASVYVCVSLAAAFVVAMSNRAAVDIPGCPPYGAPCSGPLNDATTWVLLAAVAWFCSFLWVLADYIVKRK